MSHETMLARAQEVADRILAPAARANDKDGRFSTEAIEALSEAGRASGIHRQGGPGHPTVLTLPARASP
jgi:hypothetical protein